MNNKLSQKPANKLLLLIFLCWLGTVIWLFQKAAIFLPLYSLLLLVLWLLAFTIVCLGIGNILWYFLFHEISKDGAIILVTMALGVGILMAGTAILGAFGILRPIILIGIFLMGFIAGILVLIKSPIRLKWRSNECLPMIGLAIAIFWTLLTVCTASPFYDQLHYHLAFPFYWLRTGHITTFARQAFSFFPANMGLLYTYGLAIFGTWATQALHWWMGAYSVLGIGMLATLLSGRKAGWWSALFFAITPTVLLSSTWAAADLGTSAFAIAGWLLIIAAWRREEIRNKMLCWFLCGTLAGLAAGCKISAIATVAIPLFLGVLFFPHEHCRKRIRSSLFWLGGAFISFSPWLIRNIWVTGNPFYPFFSKIFHWGILAKEMVNSPHYADALANVSKSGPSIGQLFSLGTFKPTGAAGIIGPIYLVLLPLVIWIVLKKQKRSLLVLTGASIIALIGWSTGPLLGRYQLPVLALLAIPMGIGWQALLERIQPRLRFFLICMMAVLLCWNFILGNTKMEISRIACTLGLTSEQDIMKQYASYWGALPLINDKLPKSAKLLLVGESRIMGIELDLVVEDPFHKPLLTELAEKCDSASAIAKKLHEMGITHILINYQDARRQAALNNRSNYFELETLAEKQRLQLFLQKYLEKLFSEDAVSIMLLKNSD